MLDELSCQIMRMRYIYDLPSKMIAEILKMKVNTVDVRIKRAKKKLYELMKGDEIWQASRKD